MSHSFHILILIACSILCLVLRPAERRGRGQMPWGPATFRGPGEGPQSTLLFVSNFLILLTYLSAMISSQSVPLLAILASSLTLTCLSLIKSNLYPNLVIFISETSVEFVIFFLFLQLQLLPNSLVSSKLDYCNSLYSGISQVNLNKLQRIQNSLARVITNTSKYQHITPILKKLHWLPIKQRIDYKLCLLTYKTLTNQQPTYLLQ